MWVQCDSGEVNRPHIRPGKATLLAPVALMAACGVGFLAVYALTVRTTPGRQFGDASLRGALLTSSGVANAVDTILGVVSIASLLAGIAVIALFALARLQRASGVVAVGLVLATNASAWVLKNHLLSRPDLALREVTPATHNSLPSGHTTAVFSVVVAVLFVAPSGWRKSVAVAGGTASIAMALATLSAGWHRAGDSVAGFALVGTWAGLAALVVGALDADGPGTHHRSASNLLQRWLVAMTAGTAGIAACLAVGLVLIPALRTSAVGAVAAFLSGGLLIVATAVAVLIGVQSALVRTGR